MWQTGGPLSHMWLAQSGSGGYKTSVLSGWDDEVRDATVRSMLTETVARVTWDDPVQGDWCIEWNEFSLGGC